MRTKRPFSALRGRLKGTAQNDERLPTSTPVRLLHLLAALLGGGAVCALGWQMSGVHVQDGSVPSSSLPLVSLAAASAAASSTGNRSDELWPSYPLGSWVAPMSTAYGDGAGPSTSTGTNHNVDSRLDFVRAARKGDMAASNVATLSPPPSPPPPPPSPPPPPPPPIPTPPPTPPQPPFPPPEPPNDTPLSRDIELDDEGRLLPYRLPEGANPRYRWVVASKSKEVWSVEDMTQVSRETESELDEQARIDQSHLDKWRLTRSLVRNLARHNILLVTWANDNHFDFVQNWVWHLRGLNVTNFLVGAMDEVILHKLIDTRVPTFNMKTGLDTKDLGWGTAAFHKMGRTKVSLIQSVLSLGVDVLVCDIDTVWLQDPTPFLLKHPHADVLTSSDHLANTVMGVSAKSSFMLESPSRAWSAFNIGVIFFRQPALPFVKHWNALVTKKPDYWDQNAFNDLLKAGFRGSGNHKPAPNGLWRGYNKKLRAGILPVSTFCSGHTYFVQRLPMRTHRKAYVVHATFQFSGSVGKRHRFRETQLWNDAAEYYDPPDQRGFLSYQPYIPDSLKKKPTTHNPSHLIELHFKLVNYQLTQLRSALALASTLNRILIMPKLWCLLDRWWAPHEGRIPGTWGPPPGPFVCPMDHVLNLERMAANFSVADFGPHVHWREYSFLSNPRLPSHVASSKVNVRVAACRPEPTTSTPHSSSSSSSSSTNTTTVPCSLSARRDHPNEVVLPSRFTHVEASHALAAHADVRIVHFLSLRSGTFRGIMDREAYQRFERRLKEYTSIWCCKRAHPGHIHYDLFWDVKNHTDKHNKRWTGPWVPRPGP